MHKSCRDEYIHDALDPSGSVDEKYCICFSNHVLNVFNFLCLMCVLVVMIVCVHACFAQPSAALDRVGSAQQGAWSLGLQRTVDVWTCTLTFRTA